MTYQLIRLLEGMWTRNCTIKPTSFKRIFSRIRNKFFVDFVENDAEEAYSSIIQQIQEELSENGYLSELSTKYNKVKQNKINGIKELEKVIGIGNRIARKLVVDYHIMNVDQLKKAIKKGKVKVNDKILIVNIIKHFILYHKFFCRYYKIHVLQVLNIPYQVSQKHLFQNE